MSDKRVSDMTEEELQQLAGARPVAYYKVTMNGRTWLDAKERYDDLSLRDLLARSRAKLEARGEYDPAKHGTEDREPLSLHEHLEVLANGAVVAHVYRHPGNIDQAVKAGATWEQIAEALGTSEAEVRQEYREFAEGQHRMWAGTGCWEGHEPHRFGMPDDEFAAAMARVNEEREAG